NVPGVSIPDALVERMEKAQDQQEEGIRICVETVKALRGVEGVRGVHVMAVAWESVVPRIVEEAGLLPRPRVERPKLAPAGEAAPAGGAAKKAAGD
ncbi:MAG: methylenetetrahydrofolate reductase, partial [Deinococcus sp.]|nr:methylenetetrahydrofolate reductase [Deinococcus sp.]